jgi:hypothetical protein
MAVAVLALAACSPAAPEVTTPSSAASPLATGESSVTASASPSASPETSATVGALVEGFPQQLLPLMPGATIVSSSFDRSATPATVALVGSVAGQPAPVVDFYTQALEAQGFKAVPGETVGAVASKDFLRGDNETVNLSVVESAGVSTFTIGANVAVESAK